MVCGHHAATQYIKKTLIYNSGEKSATVGGNVRNSGEIEYALRNLRLEIVIHNSA